MLEAKQPCEMRGTELNIACNDCKLQCPHTKLSVL